MALSKHHTLRVRILVKAFPQPSEKHEETVCCAGITEDGRQLRFPCSMHFLTWVGHFQIRVDTVLQQAAR